MRILKSHFGTTPCGKDVFLYTLENACGTQLQVLTYGLRVHKLFVKDKNGTLGDVVLGYDTLAPYLGADYQGAFVGRYANRIGGGTFTLEGETYSLSQNDGVNALHGGPGGYHQVVWEVKSLQEGNNPSIVFSHTSPHGDEHYPGTLALTVTYTLTAENAIHFCYEAVCDKATPFNPTNHAFFNLSGDHTTKIYDTKIQLFATKTTEVQEDLIPTGTLLPVTNTALDFTAGKLLGDDMFSQEHTIALCGGFDHNFCVDGAGMRLHAVAQHAASGRKMEVYSDMPGIQLYTFNHASHGIGKNGIEMSDHTAFCLETQYYPDSVHHEAFPFAYLQPGIPFRSETIYKFC